MVNVAMRRLWSMAAAGAVVLSVAGVVAVPTFDWDGSRCVHQIDQARHRVDANAALRSINQVLHGSACQAVNL